MTETTKGVLAILSACVVWGFSPLYYNMLSHVPPLELLSHRTVWSLTLLGAFLTWQGRLSEVFKVLSGRNLILVVVCALVISINWGGFILSVQIGMVVQSSLGYFIFPLAMAALGWIFFNEKMSLGKVAALTLAVLAVLTLTVGMGVAPWLSLVLGGTFAVYGAVKKTLTAGPVVSVCAEVFVLAPFALIWLLGTHLAGWEGVLGRNGAVFGQHFWDSALLIVSGLITAIPLMLISYASRRLALSTVGILQYINPSLQFTCAVTVLAEPITRWHMIAFPMIWLALAIYSVEAIRQDKLSRKGLGSTSFKA